MEIPPSWQISRVIITMYQNNGTHERDVRDPHRDVNALVATTRRCYAPRACDHQATSKADNFSRNTCDSRLQCQYCVLYDGANRTKITQTKKKPCTANSKTRHTRNTKDRYGTCARRTLYSRLDNSRIFYNGNLVICGGDLTHHKRETNVIN